MSTLEVLSEYLKDHELQYSRDAQQRKTWDYTVSKTCIKEGTLIRLSRSMTFSTHYIFFRDSGITTGVCKQCPKGAGWFVALSTLEASKIKLPFFFSLELSQSLKLLLKIDSQFSFFCRLNFVAVISNFIFYN